MLFEKFLIAFGATVKVDATGMVSVLLVRFTDESEPDLEGDFFTKDTDFDFVDGERTAVYYQHGMDDDLGQKKIADGVLKMTDAGVWLQAQLDVREKYEAALVSMGHEEKLGWSSGTAPHLVEREERGASTWIRRWPLRLDASLTPTPADPGNVVMTFKSYKEGLDPGLKAGKPKSKSDGDSEAPTSKGTDKPKKPTTKGVLGMKPKVKLFPIGDLWMAYALDDEGNKTGDPLKAFAKEDEGTNWVSERNAPEAVQMATEVGRAVAKAVAEVITPLIAEMKAEPRGLVVDPTKSYAEVKVANKWTFGDFLWAVTKHDTALLKEIGSEYQEFKTDDGTKVLGDQTGAAGGNLVPTVFIPDLITVEPEDEIVYPRADKLQVSGPIAVPGITTTGAGAGRSNFLGGMWAFWTERGEQKHEIEPEFTQIELTPHELSGYTEVKESLINRSRISLDPLLRGLFRETLTYVRDEAMLDGTGAGQPWGIINSPGTFIQARQTAGTIMYRDLVRLKMHLLPRSWTRAHWIFNITAYEALSLIQDDNGNFIWRQDAVGGEPRTVMGLPYVFTEKTPVLGQSGDVVLADERYYYVADEMTIMIATSEHFRFRHNRIAYKFVLYVDGQEKLQAPIVLKDGVTEVSPFVILGAAAS